MSSPSTKIVGLSTTTRGAVTDRYQYTPGILLPEDESFLVAALVRFNGGLESVDAVGAQILANGLAVTTGWQLSLGWTAQQSGSPTLIFEQNYYTLGFSIGTGAANAIVNVDIPAAAVTGRWAVIYGLWAQGAVYAGINGSLTLGDVAATYANAVAAPLVALNAAAGSAPCTQSFVSVSSVGIKSFPAATTVQAIRGALASLVSETMDFHFALRADGTKFTPAASILADGFDYQWNIGADSNRATIPDTFANRGTGSAVALTRTGAVANFSRNVSDVQYAAPTTQTYIEPAP